MKAEDSEILEDKDRSHLKDIRDADVQNRTISYLLDLLDNVVGRADAAFSPAFVAYADKLAETEKKLAHAEHNLKCVSNIMGLGPGGVYPGKAYHDAAYLWCRRAVEAEKRLLGLGWTPPERKGAIVGWKPPEDTPTDCRCDFCGRELGHICGVCDNDV